ncbi:MAG: hypothetical protein U0354_18355 [Candidatus Sericytochromatia bacterium]
MKSISKKIFSVALLSVLLSCNTEINQKQSSINLDNVNNINIIDSNKNQNNQKYIIKGQADLKDFGKGFSIKATDDIGIRATVSLIYPSDYTDANLREATIATGLTDVNGNFTINANFTPTLNQVMILEASKRGKGVGYASLSLRTHIMWTNTGWQSITGSGIKINQKTTAVALISSLEPNILSSNNTINKITYNGTLATINYDTNFTEDKYKRYFSRVYFALENLYDPVKFYYDYAIERANTSSVKANMHTMQTTLETYSVDWSGLYPETLEALEQEAKDKKYWKELKNPFNSSSTNTVYINDSEYQQAKTTLTFKGQPIEDMSFFRGAVIYKPYDTTNVNGTTLTAYFIYGLDMFGDYIKDRDVYFVLTNG